ncbi:MAG TPA: putative 4-hydroxybenzoate polyprenyltransferase [Candidatus Mucispirillum faecigallinarum]|uniref:4-hydroxybenzoate polyprenyltransferase n=1 Tax=Candidatus Mucispirillum faecigallinarum TaxID=2838699 RepID=A0A9D2GTK8_9BACT|nr:putative 4-hydroxybenzoate polyprenyltransferase [Candidatus Mucispirillum faecigallinarum]
MKSFFTFLKMIKLEHSLFALPFAFVGMFLAANGMPSWNVILWVVVAMVGARSAAMGLNRYADAEIDARNPRTASREIPAGNISKKSTIFYIILSLAVYFLAALMLNRLTAILSPIPILIFILYAYAKRFTNFCHIILGIALGLAPVCAWIAVTGTINLPPFILGGAIILWVAGFDILYAIQDIEYDRKEGLHSIPAVFGVSGSLIIARLLHFAAFFLFILLMAFTNLGYIYLAGVLISGALMAYEHSLVSKDDLSKLNMAFFNMNAYISITIMIFSIIDIWVGK